MILLVFECMLLMLIKNGSITFHSMTIKLVISCHSTQRYKLYLSYYYTCSYKILLFIHTMKTISTATITTTIVSSFSANPYYFGYKQPSLLMLSHVFSFISELFIYLCIRTLLVYPPFGRLSPFDKISQE